MSEDFSSFAEAILPTVLNAGAATMRHFRCSVVADTKSDGSPVTIADRESEEIILAGLAAVAPNILVVAEEASADGCPAAIGTDFFLVDPLDGTREFTSGREEFTINIGLIRNGVPNFGIIYAPALAKLYLTLSTGHAIAATLDPKATSASLSNLNATRISAPVRQKRQKI